MKAFVLGAGLGTRLQPLTEWLPKPMVPVYHRPLISYAFDHLKSVEDIDGFIVNTHHYPEAYTAAFPNKTYGGLPIEFRHEPVLLETAGGIANIADLLGNEPFLVYNGDILSDIPLEPLLVQHRESKNEVTLLLAAIAYELVHTIRCLAEEGTGEGMSLDRVRAHVLKVATVVVRHARGVYFRIAAAKSTLWEALAHAMPGFLANAEVAV